MGNRVSQVYGCKSPAGLGALSYINSLQKPIPLMTGHVPRAAQHAPGMRPGIRKPQYLSLALCACPGRRGGQECPVFLSHCARESLFSAKSTLETCQRLKGSSRDARGLSGCCRSGVRKTSHHDPDMQSLLRQGLSDTGGCYNPARLGTKSAVSASPCLPICHPPSQKGRGGRRSPQALGVTVSYGEMGREGTADRLGGPPQPALLHAGVQGVWMPLHAQR